MTKVKEMLDKEGPTKTFLEARKAAREYLGNLRARGEISYSDERDGDTPSVHITRRTLPEAWEAGIMALMGIGRELHTQYDIAKDGEYVSFPSLDATVMMHIVEPQGEPRFHKHFLGGWMGFGDYKAEIEGVKDGWMIQQADVAEKIRGGKFQDIKEDKRWNYTYSQRMRAYPYFNLKGELKTVNQLQSVINTLLKEPGTRFAQCITWDPRWDHNDGQIDGAVWSHYHPPCLQRLWFRCGKNTGGEYVMNVNSHWRSRDHLKAVPSNIYGIIEGMIEHVRIGLQEKIGQPVKLGSYKDINDSLHIYGHYIDPRRSGLDAEAYLEDVFRIASGEPISERVIAPGTDMHDIMMEDIKKEYEFRKANPMFGSNM